MTVSRKKVLMVTPEVYSYGGLLIGGIIRSTGCNVVITKDLTKIIELSKKANLICLSLQSTSHLFALRNLIGELKRDQNKLIVAGGPAVQDVRFASRFLPFVDAFVIGEGDETIIDILHVKDKNDLENVRGVAFRQDIDIIKTDTRKAPELSGRPFPIVPSDLRHQYIRGVNVYIEICRGCIGNCVFCEYCHMFGHRIRSRPMGDILNEVRYFQEYGIEKIALSGGDVSLYGFSSANRQENFVNLVMEVSGVVGKDNLAGPDIRPDTINPVILDGVRKYTEGWIFVGIESGSERVLNFIKKNVKLDEIGFSIDLARKHDVHILGSFMVGFVNEQHSDFLETKRLVEQLQLDKYSINIAEPLPATPYWELTRNYPLQENPLFTPSDKTIFDISGLTVAEYRALSLYALVHKITKGSKMNKKTFKQRLRSVRKETKRIQAIVKELKGLN